MNNEYIQSFSSISEAARKVYGNRNANVLIWKCANHKLSNYKGYKWKYT